MSSEIVIAQSDSEIQNCFPVFKELRPHLNEDDFLPQVRRQQAQSFQILAFKCKGIVKSVAGFRFAESLSWGKVLYIDDLITLPAENNQGYAGELLDWLITYAKNHQCAAVHLDTGYTRHKAHRLYLRKGFQLNAHHLTLQLEPVTTLKRTANKPSRNPLASQKR